MYNVYTLSTVIHCKNKGLVEPIVICSFTTKQCAYKQIN